VFLLAFPDTPRFFSDFGTRLPWRVFHVPRALRHRLLLALPGIRTGGTDGARGRWFAGGLWCAVIARWL